MDSTLEGMFRSIIFLKVWYECAWIFFVNVNYVEVQKSCNRTITFMLIITLLFYSVPLKIFNKVVVHILLNKYFLKLAAEHCE